MQCPFVAGYWVVLLCPFPRSAPRVGGAPYLFVACSAWSPTVNHPAGPAAGPGVRVFCLPVRTIRASGPRSPGRARARGQRVARKKSALGVIDRSTARTPANVHRRRGPPVTPRTPHSAAVRPAASVASPFASLRGPQETVHAELPLYSL